MSDAPRRDLQKTQEDIRKSLERRLRSNGVLSPGELSQARAAGMGLSYDSLQTGWITDCCVDDLGHDGLVVLQNVPGASAPYKSVDHHKARYELRHWHASDLPRFRALLDDPAVWRFMPEAMPAQLDDDMALALIELSNASNHHDVRAVLRNGEIVGQVRILFDDSGRADGAAEISYWLGQSYWGMGIGSEVVRLFARRCLADHPGIASLYARVHAENTASRRVLAKAGFANERPDPKDPAWRLVFLTRDADA